MDVYTPATILQRIQPLSEAEGYAAAQALLQHPATRLHEGGTNRRVTVKQADYAWGTRLNIARKKGLPPLPGCQHLVGALNKLPGETALEYVIFEHGDGLGVFWFVEQTGVPIGFIVACLAEAPATSN